MMLLRCSADAAANRMSAARALRSVLGRSIHASFLARSEPPPRPPTDWARTPAPQPGTSVPPYLQPEGIAPQHLSGPAEQKAQREKEGGGGAWKWLVGLAGVGVCVWFVSFYADYKRGQLFSGVGMQERLHRQQLRHTDTGAWRRGGDLARPLPPSAHISTEEREALLRDLADLGQPFTTVLALNGLATSLHKVDAILALPPEEALQRMSQPVTQEGKKFPLGLALGSAAMSLMTVASECAALLVDYPAAWHVDDRVRLQVARELFEQIVPAARSLRTFRQLMATASPPVEFPPQLALKCDWVLTHALAHLGRVVEAQQASEAWQADAAATNSEILQRSTSIVLHGTMATAYAQRGQWTQYEERQRQHIDAFTRAPNTADGMQHALLPLCALSHRALQHWRPAKEEALVLAQHAFAALLPTGESEFKLEQLHSVVAAGRDVSALQRIQLGPVPYAQFELDDIVELVAAPPPPAESELPAHIVGAKFLHQRASVQHNLSAATILQQLAIAYQAAGDTQRAKQATEAAGQLAERATRTVDDVRKPPEANPIDK